MTRDTFAQVLAEWKRTGKLDPRKRFADQLLADWDRADREATRTQ